MDHDRDDDRRPLPAPPGDTASDDRRMLLEFLEYFRAVFARKVEGVDADGLRQRVGTSDLTLGGLLKHLAFVEDEWFTDTFAGEGPVEPWASAPWGDDRDWEFHSAVDDEPDELLALFDAACARSRAITDASPTIGAHSVRVDEDGRSVSLRWILVHMIEEYARHCGHADLLREAVDGVVGD